MTVRLDVVREIVLSIDKLLVGISYSMDSKGEKMPDIEEVDLALRELGFVISRERILNWVMMRETDLPSPQMSASPKTSAYS